MECVNQQAGLPVPQIVAPDLHRKLPGPSPSSLEYVWNWTFEKGIAALDAHAPCPESPHTSPKSRPMEKENDSIPILETTDRVLQGASLRIPHSEHVKTTCNGNYYFSHHEESLYAPGLAFQCRMR